MSRKLPIGIRITSWIVIFTFSLNTCLETFSKSAYAYSTPAPATTNLKIPEQFGTVDYFHQGTSPKTIFFIQDSHTSLEAQENISQLIQHFVSKEGIRFVFEEGYEGKVPTDLYFGTLNAQDKKNISHFFLDCLRLSAAEYSHINRKQDFVLLGAERKDLYLDSLRQYQKAASFGPFILQGIKSIEQKFNSLEGILFPSDFKRWVNLKKQFMSDQLPLSDYIFRTIQYQLSRDSTAFNATSFPILSELYSQTQIKDPESLKRLKSIFEEVGWQTFFDELEQLEQLLIKTLDLSSDAQLLYRYEMDLQVVKKLARMEITEEEYRYYHQSIAQMNSQVFAEFMKRHSKNDFSISSLWEAQIQEIVHFYETVDLREASLKAALSGSEWNKSVLVFGGFHRSGIVNILNELGFSYYVISPKTTQMDVVHEERYRKLMLGMVYSFEQPFWKSVSVLHNAARIISLFYMPHENFAALLQRIDETSIPEAGFDVNEVDASVGVRSEVRRGKQLFEPVDSLLVSVGKLKVTLDAAGKNSLLQEFIFKSFQDYLSTYEIQPSDHLKLFLERFLSALSEHVESEYLQFEHFSDAVTHLSRLPGLKNQLKDLLSAPNFDLSLSSKRAIKETFRALGWGAHPDDSFFFTDVELPPVKFKSFLGRAYNSKQILRQIQVLFSASPNEIMWYAAQLFPNREVSSFQTQDWQRLISAMAYDNQFVKETKIAGFRSVQGRKRWSHSTLRLSLWRPSGEEITRKIEHVFGLNENDLNRLVKEVPALKRQWQDLTDSEKLMIYGRLQKANKTRFARLDQQRYKKGNVPKFQGSLQNLAFAAMNSILSLILTIFVRQPLHLFEQFLIKFFREEIIYEHLQRDRDFVSRAKSQEVVKDALVDIQKGKKKLSDRLYVSPIGTLSRSLDHFWMGSFLKATIKFVIKRFYMAVIFAVSVGVLATFGVSPLSYGMILSLQSLVPMTSGIVGVGSLVSYAATLPVVGHLQVPFTVVSIARAFLTVLFLQIPSHFISKFRNRRLTNPAESVAVTVIKTLLIDLILSPSFWMSILVSTFFMLLVGAEISAIVQYAAAMDWLVFGTTEEVPVENFTAEHMQNIWTIPAWLKPLEGVITGKMHVEGVDHALEGPVFTRGAALVEHDAMSIGSRLFDQVQNELNFNLSDWVFHRLGGEPSVSANEILQTAEMFARLRYIHRGEELPEISDLDKQAKIGESRLNELTSLRQKAAYDLLQKPAGEAVEHLGRMSPEGISLIAREYARDHFKVHEQEILKLADALQLKSFDQSISFLLSYRMGRVAFEDTGENRKLLNQTFKSLSQNQSIFEEASLRALANSLDDLEPNVMAAVLKNVNSDLIRQALERAPLIPMVRKERLLELSRLLETRQTEIPTFKIKTKTLSASEAGSEIEKILDFKFDPASPTALREIADHIELLTEYDEDINDIRVLHDLEVRYEWLLLVQNKDGSFTHLGIQDYAAAGKALFQISRFFARHAEIEPLDSATDRYKQIADSARVAGLKTANYAFSTFREQLHVAGSERIYASGHNYPEMIHLFDEAYQATGDRKWYQVEKHIAENIVENRIVLSRKLFPEFEYMQVDRPYLNLDGNSVDLFKAMNDGARGFRFIVKERSWIPSFQVGFNEELGEMIEESKLQVISELVITHDDGTVVDTLKFGYDEKGILEDIKSTNGMISYHSERKPIVKHVSVFHIDANSGIPYGISYRYAYNKLGELQYIVKENVITVEGTFKKHPINTIVKDTKGEAMKDLDIPQGLRPDRDRLRAHEVLDSAMDLDAFGRSLEALSRVKFRADQERDWKLSSDAQTVAYAAIKSFFDHLGRVRQNSRGQFSFFDKIDSKSGALNTFTANAYEQADLLLGVAPWTASIEQANQAYREGIRFFKDHPEQSNLKITSTLQLAKLALPQSGTAEKIKDFVDSKLQDQVVDELKNMLSYGEKTANFKFANVQVRQLKIDEIDSNAIFLNWDPIPEAQWYLLREYQQNESGEWKHIEQNDQWTFKNYISLDDPTGTQKRYVVMGFTADPIFESFGPFHGTKSLNSVPREISPAPQNALPGNAYIIVGEKHLVGAHEEWIDLSEDFHILAKEFLQYPHSKGAEWEIAKDRHFEQVVKKFYTHEEIPKLFLKGLANGDYYIRARVWSGEREELDHPLTEFGSRTVETVALEPVQSSVQVKDKTIIEWEPTKDAKFYRLKIWFREGNLDRYIKRDIVTTDPFIDVRKFTSQPVNRIEITPFSANPRLGGIAGPATGPISVDVIEGAQLSSEVQDIHVVQNQKDRSVLQWKSEPKAMIYQIETMSRSAQDTEAVETYWSSAFASQYQLTNPAQFVRIQAWTDHPDNGGQPVTKYSPWVEVGADFERPQAVKIESIHVEKKNDSFGNVRAKLIFDGTSGAAGYKVTTHNRRGGSYTYWVPQPTDNSAPSVDLVMDMDDVEIYATTNRIQGKRSDVTQAYVSSDVSLDHFLAPFEIIEESPSNDFNENGLQDPVYFSYDLSQAQKPGVNVSIQYATKFKNEEPVLYPAQTGNVLYPSFDADRVKSRLIWTYPDGHKIISDWSEWKNTHVDVNAPVRPEQLKQTGERTATTEDVQARVPAEQKIIGYMWETKNSFNDPEEQAKTYRTNAKFYNGQMINNATTLHLSSSANFIRAKAVYWSPQGEIASPKWSDWKEIHVQVDSPAKVEQVHVESGRVLFGAHKDPRVNAYVIEASDDPFGDQAMIKTYSRRIVKENQNGETAVIQTNNYFDLPISARYVRVTPVIIYDEDDRILGTESEWVPTHVFDGLEKPIEKTAPEAPQALDLIENLSHSGRWIMAKHVNGANFYQIETRDRNGVVRTKIHSSPAFKATGDFVAFRMKPVNGNFESGEFIIKKDGEWTDWNFIREVPAPLEPQTPENIHIEKSEDGMPQLVWKGEYSKQYGATQVLLFSYIVQMEDKNGNLIQYGPLTAPHADIPFEAVRARVKAVKTKSHVQSFLNPTFDSESDWSPWLPIAKEYSGDGPNSIEFQINEDTKDGEHGIAVQVKHDPKISAYVVQTISEGGYIQESVKLASDFAKTGYATFYPDYMRIAKVRIIGRVPVDQPDQTRKLFQSSPAYVHRWMDVPGRSIQRLETPQIKNSNAQGKGNFEIEWGEVKPLESNRAVTYRVHGIRADGEEVIFPATPKTKDLFGAKTNEPKPIKYIAIEAVQTNQARTSLPLYDSAFSNLVPLFDESRQVNSQPPVENQVVSSGIINWPEVHYEIKIHEKGSAEPATVTTSRFPYAPDALLPKGADAYEIEVSKISGFLVELNSEAGIKKTIRRDPNVFTLNLSQLPPDKYKSIQVRYVTQGEFLGVHGKWADPKGIRVEHPTADRVLYIRPTGEHILTAYFNDGFKAEFDRTDKHMIRAFSKDGTEVKISEVSEEYRLKPSEIFDTGEQWTEITPSDEFEKGFYDQYYQMRNLIENRSWSVPVASSTLTDNPTNLLGVSTSGVFYITSPSGEPVGLESSQFQLSSKQNGGSNPGALESKWSSDQYGFDVYTRKYLVGDLKTAVLDLATSSTSEKTAQNSAVLALQVKPSESTGTVSVKQVGDYQVIVFGTGEFMAARKDQVADWYLGPQSEAAMWHAEMANDQASYEGAAEKGVLYLRVPVGAISNHVFIYTGIAHGDQELKATLQKATQEVNVYETAYSSMATHPVRDGILPEEFFNHYFLDVLQNRGWNAERGTYWEMIGSGNSASPVNALASNASWTGNSSLVQQLNVEAYPILVSQNGSDRINEAGETLLRDRILPNAEWILKMMTPTDSTYMKVADRMRFYYPKGLVLMDNQQISAVSSLPNAIIVKRGYEPLEAFTISGSGFEIQGKTTQPRRYNIHNPNDFTFQLDLPEDVKVDSGQDSIRQTRIFHDHGKLFSAREHLELKKGEYALRYQLELQANQDLQLDHASVALSRLDADQDIEKNPEQFPGFQGENGILIAGMDEIFRARNLFESNGLTESDKGEWIDLLSLFEGSQALRQKGEEIRKQLKTIGAIGITGWDKEGLLYLKEGIDYDRGYRVMVKLGEHEADGDLDHIVEFTDLRLDIPVDQTKQQIKAGDVYHSPTVYFTNFWVRLGVTDQRNVPEDLKHMMFDWIRKIDHDAPDGLSMESDYAYTESVTALWTTAHFLVDRMVSAHEQGQKEEEEHFRTLAAKYALAAIRGTVSSRDVDRSNYDPETGLVREDIMNSKGIMRFYGTFTVNYGMAREFMERLSQLAKKDSNLILFSDKGQAISLYDAVILDAEQLARDFWDEMTKSENPKEALRAKAYAEIYLSKVAKFKALKVATDRAALEDLITNSQAELQTITDPFTKTLTELAIYHAQKQLAYLKSFTHVSTTDVQDTDYWYQEILLSAERILKLQQLNESQPNYGGFYQNEQPSKMQLDDNGTKLWALRLAHDMVDREIQNMISSPSLKTLDLRHLYDLYQKKLAYREAAYINIQNWIRIDPRDGHLYGWESAKREEDFDSQRTPYGNETYRLRGLASWMDILPEAKEKFDRSSRQHRQELGDRRRLWSPRGIKMTQSYDNPGDGNDTSTEVLPTAMLGFVKRASGGTFNQTPVAITLLGQDQKDTAQIIKRRNYYAHFAFNVFGWFGVVSAVQMFLELNLLARVFKNMFKALKSFLIWSAQRTTTNRFVFYQLSILSITAAFIVWQVNLVNLDATNWKWLVVMMSLAAYVIKNASETIVRRFRLGMMTDQTKLNAKSGLELDPKPFPQGALHLSSAVSVPLFTTGADALISHGTAEQDKGTFHNMALKNISEENRTPLIFHINDQSPDSANPDGFNAKKFHEDYFRGMNERISGNRFFYTHQPGNSDKKFGAVQAMDSWWYALKGTIRLVMNDIWDSLSAQQKSNLLRASYGLHESMDISAFKENKTWTSQVSDLVVQMGPDGKLKVTLKSLYQNDIFLAEDIELPRDGQEIYVQLKAPRADGLSAVLPVWIKREGDQLVIYHFNENPNSANVVVDEVRNGTAPRRVGLLVHEKENMIEEEARALLYRFWASEYGGTNTIGDDLVHHANVTSGKAQWLTEAELEKVRVALSDGTSNAEAIFIQKKMAARLSEAMADQSSTYFDKVEDVELRASLDQILFPEPFDHEIKAWTDVDLLDGPTTAETVAFELETGKRAVPGQYYHLSPMSYFEAYENPALIVIDQANRRLEEIQTNTKLSVREKKKLANEYLKKVNPILRRIREVTPVKRSYQVRYNPARNQTQILEEVWILYEYEYEDGRRDSFFKVERKVRFDTVVGHIPTIGPLAYIWRFDNDETVDLEEGDRGTLQRGLLMAGHPHTQPVVEPGTYRTVTGFGGMSLPVSVGNTNVSHWTTMALRNRKKSKWDLRHQWAGFREVQYTGTGIENLDSSDRAKADQMTKGKYKSHDMREPAELGPAVHTSQLFSEMRRAGLVPAFLTGRTHPDFPKLEAFIKAHFISARDPQRVVFMKYGRELTLDSFLETLSYGAEVGGFGLLDGLQGYEQWFPNLEFQWQADNGRWKEGDNQWLSDGFGGVNIRGAVKLPGAMPGFVPTFSRTLERSVVVVDGNIAPVFVGQDYRPTPLTDPQKYFITRTFEEDQRGAVMFVWLMGTLILAAFNHKSFTLLNLPVLAYLSLFAAIGSIIGIMKFSEIFRDIQQNGLTRRNAVALKDAVHDVVVETIIFSGLNLWKALLTTIKIIFRAPTMKWVTSAQARNGRSVADLKTYGSAALLAFAMISFILAVHPNWTWLTFGGLFLGSLLFGPILAHVAAQKPSAAKFQFRALGVFAFAAGLGFYFALALLGIPGSSIQEFFMIWGFRLGIVSATILGSIAAVRFGQKIFKLTGILMARSVQRTAAFMSFAFGSALGMASLVTSASSHLALVYSFKKNFPSPAQIKQKASWRSVSDYFFVKGVDRTGLFSNTYKAFGNLIVMIALWTTPLFASDLVLRILGFNSIVDVVFTAIYVGLFFPVGFWILDHALSPHRNFNVLNPIDWARVFFHTTSAVIGNTFGLILTLFRTVRDILSVPYLFYRYRKFVRTQMSSNLPASQLRLADDTAQLIRNGPERFRVEALNRITLSKTGNEKVLALIRSGLLDDQTIGDLTTSLYWSQAGLEMKASATDSVVRAEVRKTKPAIDMNFASNFTLDIERTQVLTRQRHQLEVLSDLQNMRGAVALDARSFVMFSPEQQTELISTAISDRAQVVIYHKNEVPAESLVLAAGVRKIKVIEEGLSRATVLLAGHPKIVTIFSDESEGFVEARSAGPRVLIFKQIEGTRPGLITAALLKAELGQKYGIFKNEDGVYTLIDERFLDFVNEFLGRELISKSA